MEPLPRWMTVGEIIHAPGKGKVVLNNEGRVGLLLLLRGAYYLFVYLGIPFWLNVGKCPSPRSPINLLFG